ncbi:MAG: nucleoside 2-deoxyribosyltransferase [Deferribacteres bacterium]|nr:nucleoside 2-deoxyribosyltransferase [candidate division KSB1 bacterium]MCB9503392.1 nucleoside 2-deoxyribosyltransferase [Deferribacteres bacterium]
MKIYFAASIRGGRENQAVFAQLIAFIKQNAQVLTEHIGSDSLTEEGENMMSDEAIFTRDIEFIQQADAVIAEVSTPSLGVGYELGFAESLGKPVLCLYNSMAEKPLSAMISGNAYFNLKRYTEIDESFRAIQEFLKNMINLRETP